MAYNGSKPKDIVQLPATPRQLPPADPFLERGAMVSFPAQPQEPVKLARLQQLTNWLGQIDDLNREMRRLRRKVGQEREGLLQRMARGARIA